MTSTPLLDMPADALGVLLALSGTVPVDGTSCRITAVEPGHVCVVEVTEPLTGIPCQTGCACGNGTFYVVECTANCTWATSGYDLRSVLRRAYGHRDDAAATGHRKPYPCGCRRPSCPDYCTCCASGHRF